METSKTICLVEATSKIISSLRRVLQTLWLSLKCLISAWMTSQVLEAKHRWVTREVMVEAFLEKEVYSVEMVEVDYLATEVEDCLEATVVEVTAEVVGMEVVVVDAVVVGDRTHNSVRS